MKSSKWLVSEDAVSFCRYLILFIHKLNPRYPRRVPDEWLERGNEIAMSSIDAEGNFTQSPFDIAKRVWLENHGELWRFMEDPID